VNFRSVNDLFSTVRKQQHMLPRDIDLVVGVPRSGLLAATAVSLLLNRPLSDLNSFLEGRVYGGFSRRPGAHLDQGSSNLNSVLIIDDSIKVGWTMREVKARILKSDNKYRLTYAAVFGLRESHPEVDLVLETCSEPRMFEWNVLNHPHLGITCVDLDVLCIGDNGGQCITESNSRNLSMPLVARHIPHYIINSIVTTRPEKHRTQMVEWLEAHKIQYNHLYMLDLPSPVAGRVSQIHAEFKAEIFSSKKNCELFIEYDTAQASVIRKLSGKNVLAYQEMVYFPEGSFAKFERATTASGIRKLIGQSLSSQSRAAIKSILKI
jgi:hypothetical protein